MVLFGKTKAVLWPKKGSVEIYYDKKESNHFSFDLNLWQTQTQASLEPLLAYLNQNRITQIDVLLPDDIIHTKSFLYDTKIDSIDTKEVITLAESFVNFKIDPQLIEFDLIQTVEKTIIRSVIYDPEKFESLKKNLSALAIEIISYRSVASAVSNVLGSFNQEPYFFIFNLEGNENTIGLAKGKELYLTVGLKGNSLDIQKTINYSNLYFETPVNKIYMPIGFAPELNSTTKLEKTQFDPSQIAISLGKAANLPLAVLAIFSKSDQSKPAIMNQNHTNYPTHPMQPKKNILPFIAVFIFTAAIASIGIWYFLNRDSGITDSSINEPTPAVEQVMSPTETPTPTIAPVSVDKAIKIQVLNATDINGQAATLKTQLTKLGFKNIAVGNSSQKQTSNQIQLKASLSSYQTYLKSELSSFKADITTDLKETSTYDAIFIIGTDLRSGAANDDANVSSPTPTETE